MRGRDRPLRSTTFQKSMDLDRALAFSRYAKSALGCDPELKAGIEATLAAPLDWAGPFASLDAAVADGDPAKLAANLRALRRHVFVHVLLRDLTGRAPLSEVMQAMTLLADRSLQATVDVHARALAVAGQTHDEGKEGPALHDEIDVCGRDLGDEPGLRVVFRDALAAGDDVACTSECGSEVSDAVLPSAVRGI